MFRHIKFFLAAFLLISSMPLMADTKPVSLKEKIGQMLLIGFKGSEVKKNDDIVRAIDAQEIGGVILFDYDFENKTYDRNIKNPEQLKKLTADLQAYAKAAALTHHNNLIPLLISVDYEGGKVNRLKEKYGFPKTLSAEALGKLTPTEVKHFADLMAQTLKNSGINFDFAPVLDVNVNPNNPVIGKVERSFSADPNVVSQDAYIFAQSFSANHIACSYKHFPGHGSSKGDTHQGFVDVTDTWQPFELDPYKKLLRKIGTCPVIMTAHVVNKKLDPQGYPASISHAITTDLLRNKLKFNGVVVTDDMQMGAIKNHYGVAEATRLAINAGADILVFGNQLDHPQDPKEIVDIIYNDVKAGKISEKRINESYSRIMNLKRMLARA